MDDGTSIEYYRKRVSGPGDIYGPPEIQEDFTWLARWLQENVAKCDVLEVACGSGHWTKIASATAGRVLAIDINWNLLQAARNKVQGRIVDLVVADAYNLPLPSSTFDCGMAHFWLSHVRRSDISQFMSGFARHFKSRSRLLFIDSKWVDGYRKPILRSDQDGNTYQLRTLKDGSQYEILKNYFTEAEWIALLGSSGSLQVHELRYSWAISVELA